MPKIRFTHPASRPWLTQVVEPTADAGGATQPPATPTPAASGQQDPGPKTDPAPAGKGDGADETSGTPKPNDARVVADLARERKRRQALEQQLSGFTDAIKRLAGEPEDDSDTSDVDRLVNRIAALEAQAQQAQVDALRMRIASETGVLAAR